MIPTGQEEEGEDQGIIHTSQLTTDSSRRTTLMFWADQGSNLILMGAEAKKRLTIGDGSSGKGQRCTMDCEACGGLVGLVGQSNSPLLKCDNEPAILALAQEIRRLRRESSITIFEHPEEGRSRATILLRVA